MVLSCATASGAVASRTASPAAGASLCIMDGIDCSSQRWRWFQHQLSRDSALDPHFCKASLPPKFREKTSLDSSPWLVYGFAAEGSSFTSLKARISIRRGCESRKRKAAQSVRGLRFAAQEDDAAPVQPVGDARHRDLRAAL